jgi:hypothetical protein
MEESDIKRPLVVVHTRWGIFTEELPDRGKPLSDEMKRQDYENYCKMQSVLTKPDLLSFEDYSYYIEEVFGRYEKLIDSYQNFIRKHSGLSSPHSWDYNIQFLHEAVTEACKAAGIWKPRN